MDAARRPPSLKARALRAALFWLPAIALLAAGPLLASADPDCPVAWFDRFGLALADAARNAWRDRLMLFATRGGSLLFLVPLAGLVAWRFWHAGRRDDAVFVVASLLGAAVAAHLGKLWVMRPRPELVAPVIAMPESWAYPSGHAMQVAATALALFLIARRGRGWVAALLGGGVLLVCVSRVYLQLHFPSDVIAGALAGALWAGGLYAARRQA
jgi:membrane-associated phospholipid phosphatase